MAPPPNATATNAAPRRQSCDRCHGQKLRCTRTGNSSTGACNRCLRQGAQCAYSPSLPKGRPSMYRLAEASISQTNTSPTETNKATRSNIVSHRDMSTSDGKSKTEPDGSLHIAEEVLLAEPMDMSTWPWPAPFNWNEMQVDTSENESVQTDVGAFLDAFPSLLGWASPGHGDCSSNSAQSGPPSQLPSHEHARGMRSERLGNSSISSNSSRSSINADKTGPDIGIAQLSQLSTRLYPLHRSSCTLAETARSSSQSQQLNHTRQAPLIDDSAFKPVTSWLVQVSADMNHLSRPDHQCPSLESQTTGDTLHGAFSASHYLLEILECLQVDAVGTPGAMSASTGATDVDYWANTTPQSLMSTENMSCFDQRKGSSHYARPSSQYSNTVMRHLVDACHTLLLNVYVGVLIALQHDADLRTSCSANSGFDSDPYTDAASLADIRLVLVVQLCSYLIGRLHQAVGLYSAPHNPHLSLQHPDSSSSRQASPPDSMASSREHLSELEVEVRQRLSRLRQTLHI